jgi:hypothetical protein
MPEPKDISMKQILASCELSATPAKGATIKVKRAGKTKELPIQFIINRLRAEYPETTFVFGGPKPLAVAKPAKA